ncbi:MAG: 4-alpha-glucanotransferase [Thermoguttaceae bacterium]
MNLKERTSGILLHLSSLPGKSCCGDLGEGARKFADFLQDAGQRNWQMLPVNPIDLYHSPYASVSAFAGEPIYIDLDDLVEQGLLDSESIDWEPQGPRGRTAFSAARDYRELRWIQAYKRFKQGRGGEKYRTAYPQFMEENRSWVLNHALYCTLAEHFGTFHWNDWPDAALRRANPAALEQLGREFGERIDYHIFLQLVFDVQWSSFRSYCRDRGIGLIGDVPIYVGAASADTWGNSRLFQLDEEGNMSRVAGVPADSFNPDGQRWNSPLYDWEVHKATDYEWWRTRIRTCLRRFDVVRLDHFIGFYNYFSMPPEPDPADLGSWISGPADHFFDAILEEFPKTSFIAEDLGVMNAGVHALREKYEFPGMNVFQFSFDYRRNSDPSLNWKPISVVCTGTHDTTTLGAWLEEVVADSRKAEPFWDYEFIVSLLQPFMQDGMMPKGSVNRDSLRWGIIQKVLQSPGNTAIFPMQDLLGLDKTARMNFPGHAENNWVWRLEPGCLTPELASKLRMMTERSGRLG